MKGILAILLSVFRIVVMPVQFQDTEFTYGPEDFTPVLERAGRYLDAQFRGTRTFEFTLAPAVTLKHGMDWYGANSAGIHDWHIADAVAEACSASDEAVDFSLFDGDEDGVIDCVALLTAGLSESDGAGEDTIWPQQARLSDSRATFEADGKTADPFVVINELKSVYGQEQRLCGIGDLCHEILHILGLPDFYDTNGETDGLGVGLWKSTSIMDAGNRNDNGMTPPNLNSIEMELLGLGLCDTLDCGDWTLSPIGRDGRYLKLLSPVEGEYFLMECRKAEEWDRFIGGEGLLVYHIDRSEPDYAAFWSSNTVNADASRQGACILAAEPEADEVSKVFFPRTGKTSITSEGTPSLKFHSGAYSPFAITGIRKTGDGDVTFKVSKPIIIKDIATFQDAAIVSWESEEGVAPGRCTVSWSTEGEEIGSATASGTETFTIEGLQPQTDYEVKLTVTTGSGDRCSLSAPFRTKAYIKGIKPYIYLRSADRNEDGSFIRGARIPLRVFNADDAESIEWTFESTPARTGADGFFTIERDGRLKAKVLHSDGSVSIMIKDIVVR